MPKAGIRKGDTVYLIKKDKALGEIKITSIDKTDIHLENGIKINRDTRECDREEYDWFYSLQDYATHLAKLDAIAAIKDLLLNIKPIHRLALGDVKVAYDAVKKLCPKSKQQ